MRTLAISDIHGELELFNKLLEKVNYNPKEDQLILLGDYIDRGPDSAGVLEKVRELKAQGALVLRGNHDQMMLDAYHQKAGAWERWIRNGGRETLKSYGIKNDRFPETKQFADHIAFIEALDDYYETDNYIFVHAGLDPNKAVEETDRHTLIWIRDKFHNNYEDDKTVIFGHTVTPHLHQEKGNFKIYYGPNKIIGIDGAATYGGQLNCLDITNGIEYEVKQSEKS